MRISQARLTQSHQITIPSEVRRQLQLNAGDVVYFALEGDQVVLRRLARSWTEHYRELGSEVWNQEGGGSAAIDRQRDSWQEP